MPWKKMLACVTGAVDQGLLTRLEYVLEENRALRGQIGGRLRLTDVERTVLAEKAVTLGKLMTFDAWSSDMMKRTLGLGLIIGG